MQNSTAADPEIQSKLIQIARELYQQGPCMGQEALVLNRALEVLQAQEDVRKQQEILTNWHHLFHTGQLVWGYDIVNPGHPFYHFPEWVDHDESFEPINAVDATAK